MAKGKAVAAEHEDWEAENDLRSLIEAEKIKADPKRLKAAMAKKKELAKALEKVA